MIYDEVYNAFANLTNLDPTGTVVTVGTAKLLASFPAMHKSNIRKKAELVPNNEDAYTLYY